MASGAVRSAPAQGTVTVHVDGVARKVEAGLSVAAALLAEGIYLFRTSPNAHAPRGPFCMMGACQECAIEIDGAIRRACQTEVRDGMSVLRRGAGRPEGAVTA